MQYKNSENPIRALKFLELMHKDEYLLNLICYGIEGRDYTKDSSNPKRINRESGGYYIPEFMVGSQFLHIWFLPMRMEFGRKPKSKQ